MKDFQLTGTEEIARSFFIVISMQNKGFSIASKTEVGVAPYIYLTAVNHCRYPDYNRPDYITDAYCGVCRHEPSIIEVAL